MTARCKLLQRVHDSGIESKSGLMVGFGEKRDEILDALKDLREMNCARLTIGQYQQPSIEQAPVVKYYTPDEFAELKEAAYALGFRSVESGPLVRSSYRAAGG